MGFKRNSLRVVGLLMSMMLMAGALSSCKKSGSGDKLVESIPSSAWFVVKINPQQVVENMGCSMDNGKVVLSKQIEDAIKEQGGKTTLKMVNSYLEYTEGVNMDAIMVFMTKNDGSDVAVVATLSDEDAVKKHLKELLDSEKEEDGFTIYKMGRDGVIAIKEKQLWVASKLSVINRHIESAKESNISTVKGVGEMLTADNAMAYYISLPKISKTLANQGVDIERQLRREGVPTALATRIAGVMDYNICASLTLEGNSMNGEAFLIDENGTRCEFDKFFDTIDTSFLKNVPATASCIAACGNIADPDVRSLIKEFAEETVKDANDATAAQHLYNLLTKMDGTTALALDMSGLGNVNLLELMGMSESRMMTTIMENMKIVFMSHYPEQVVNDVTGLLYDQTATNMPVNEVKSNYYEVAATGDVSLYFGNVNGYLTIGNVNVANAGATGVADKFNGKHFEIYSHSEPNAMLSKMGWDFGSESELWIEKDAIKFTTKLTGTKLNFLQAIIEPLTDMDNLKALMEMAQQMERGSGYNYYDDYDSYGYEYDEFQPDDMEWPEPDSDYDYEI